MQCPKCKHEDTGVIDSRSTEEGRTVRRRRECENCLHRFTTFERLETSTCVVVKNDGTREPFSREKLARSIWIACGKRPVTQEQVEVVLTHIEDRLLGEKEVSSLVIGGAVMEELQTLDHIAFIRFASVYRSFEAVEDFEAEIAELFKRKKKKGPS
jgi:transcriptional repressor NrdR